MAKEIEKKIDEVIEAQEVVEDAQEVEEVIEAEKNFQNTGFVLNRKVFAAKKDGTKFFSYEVNAKYHGRDVKIAFTSKDKTPIAYLLLDIVFDGKDEVELFWAENEFQDKKTRETRKSISYVAQAVADGELVRCPVKPTTSTDKAVWEALLGFNKKSE